MLQNVEQIEKDNTWNILIARQDFVSGLYVINIAFFQG